MSLVPVEWVLALHERRGRYITLADNNQRAIREGDTYDHGMVFSDRPLHVGEVFQLKIEELESKWAGSLVRNNKCCRDSTFEDCQLRRNEIILNLRIIIYMETYFISYHVRMFFLCDTIGVNAYTFKKAFLNISSNFEGETY